MASPTRRSPSARCSPPRRRAAHSAPRCRSSLVMVLKPSWSLYRGRARGRERVRPNVRAMLEAHYHPGDRRPPLGARTFASRPGVETERAMREANVSPRRASLVARPGSEGRVSAAPPSPVSHAGSAVRRSGTTRKPYRRQANRGRLPSCPGGWPWVSAAVRYASVGAITLYEASRR